MYYAIANQVFVRQRKGEEGELFLTVHPTESTVPVDVQAESIADLLNTLPPV